MHTKFDTLVRSGGEALLNRFIAGISGQAFSRLIVAAATVVWVPLMLRAWGVAGYGEWVAITSLASYLSYSNFGFVAPAANEIVMRAGAHDAYQADRQFRMAISFTMFVVLPLVLVVALGLSTLNFRIRFHFTTLTNVECVVIIAAIGCGLVTRTLLGIIVAPLYAQGAYGLVYFTYSLIGLAELILVSVLLLVFRVSPPTVAWTNTGVNGVNMLVVAFFAKRNAPWVSFRPYRLSAAWILQQMRPTAGFMLYHLGTQGILFFGARTLLSVASGGSAVAVYALYGTVMRVVDQAVLIFSAPLEVEIARSAGLGDVETTTKLVRIGTQSAWIVFVGIALAIAVFGPPIFAIWTRHQITFEYHMFALACAMVGCSHLGKVSAIALVATNRLYGPSFLMVGWSILALCLGLFLSIAYGVEGMFVGGIFGELGVSLIAIRAVASWLDLSIAAMLLDFSTIRSLIDLLLRRKLKSLNR
jgi:hypothetical protein